MEFDGTFRLDGVTIEEVWLALSDPVVLPEMNSGMTLEVIDDGVEVNWWAHADVFGRIAQMGQRIINPVAQRVVNRFFGRIEDQLTEVSRDGSNLPNWIRGLL